LKALLDRSDQDERGFRRLAMRAVSSAALPANDENRPDLFTNGGRPFSEWPSAPDDLKLECNEVHLWATSLDLPPHLISRCSTILAVDEADRAERYYFARDRNRFVAARVCLRTLLGAYLKIEPGNIKFSYNEYGKPSLAQPANTGKINFNVAHSGDVAIYGFTRGRQIGVDVEQIKPEFASFDIAINYFSKSEVTKLGQLCPAHRQRAFFDCWARKEAFIKGIGQGLSLGLDQFEVAFAPGEPAAVLNTNWDPQVAGRWSLAPINVMPGYVAAAAVEGHNWDLRSWQVPEKVYQNDLAPL